MFLEKRSPQARMAWAGIALIALILAANKTILILAKRAELSVLQSGVPRV